MGVKVKICGITNREDAWAAVNAGADALGFMLYEDSPRRISYEEVASITRDLPPFVSRVGVFVNAAEEFILRAESCGLDTLQFHGDETSVFCGRFALKTIKAFRIQDASSLEAMAAYTTQAWLLDSYVPGKQGGTGTTFNWDLAALAARRSPRVILAGGLTPSNVAAAVAQVQPYAVDVSSGVEAKPGKKDPAKLQDFIAAARSVNRR